MKRLPSLDELTGDQPAKRQLGSAHDFMRLLAAQQGLKVPEPEKVANNG